MISYHRLWDVFPNSTFLFFNFFNFLNFLTFFFFFIFFCFIILKNVYPFFCFLVFFFCFFFFFLFSLKLKINMLGLLTLVKVNSGIARDAFTQKVSLSGDPKNEKTGPALTRELDALNNETEEEDHLQAQKLEHENLSQVRRQDQNQTSSLTNVLTASISASRTRKE